MQYNYDFAGSSEQLYRITHEIKVNLTAPLTLSSMLPPLMMRQPEAALVNVSSGLGPKRSAPVYCGTKAGIHIFTKALGYQLEGTSVRVMEVIPSLVDTLMTDGRGRNKITADQLMNSYGALPGISARLTLAKSGCCGLCNALVLL